MFSLGNAERCRKRQKPAAPHHRSSAKSLLMHTNPGQSGPFYGRDAACQVFLTRPGHVNAEIRLDE